MRLFSYRDRPVHFGPYPMEKAARASDVPDLASVPPMLRLAYRDDANPQSLVNAMRPFMAMFDAIRDGKPGPLAEIPDDPGERTRHLKSAGYYFDATQMGACRIPAGAWLDEPCRNPAIAEILAQLEKGQPKSFAAGIDMIYADVLDSARTKPAPARSHSHALVILVEFPRDPRPDEPGTEWIVGSQAERAGLLASLTATMLSSYLRLLGFEARSHSASTSDVDLNKLAVAAGLAEVVEDAGGKMLRHPFCGTRFGLAAVTTSMTIAPDQPLARGAARKPRASYGPSWWMGVGGVRSALDQDPYARREFRAGAYPFETLKRVDQPTTFIDAARVPRFPKRADFFARALFGDMGKKVQEAAKGGFYVAKSPIGYCARRALGALLLLQFGDARGPVAPGTADPVRNADNLKAASYYMSCDAVGLTAVPEWAYYSHDAGGNPMPAYHKNGVVMLLDQGHETMEGCSGDDWISVAQSMRAYLRFSLLGGVIGEQIRRLGFSARVHSVIDGDVLQPPLLLLAGLGEVSRIGEVILNPYLGPRLKSGVVTTDLPMAYDKPIDFGLQTFCGSCNKCARECPSGAITAGPKLMYNGYEIWKSDAEKCARYRLTNQGGGMCGRCMKTCPWNLEGLFADALFRTAAMKAPVLAPLLARLDDALGRGGINPVKKWWWDIEQDKKSGRFVKAAHTHARGINPKLKLRYEDQTLAVYPADVMPSPLPVVQPIDREAGIARYRSLLRPTEYKERLAHGDTASLAIRPKSYTDNPPVFPVLLKERIDQTADVARYDFVAVDGRPLPAFEAGAHIDVVIAPEYQRQYSLAGDPADSSRYVIGVLTERDGRGGSMLMHRAFKPGRRVFISHPRNHFPLHENAQQSLLFAGGIGVTPLITMAHRLHALGRDFELHYSAANRQNAGFMSEIDAAPWRSRVSLHMKDEGRRAELDRLVPPWQTGAHLYTCGSPRYMDGVMAEARHRGWPEDSVHWEYFTVPEPPERENHPFRIHIAGTERIIEVPADMSAADALGEAGIRVDMKCSDGICGVCACELVSGEVDHRDYVLSASDRKHRMITCCSRASEPGAVVEIKQPVG